MSSSSIPFSFPPHIWHDGRGIFMDGGTWYNTNMNSAILQCLDMVDDESKITIDLLMCSPGHDRVPTDGTQGDIL